MTVSHVSEGGILESKGMVTIAQGVSILILCHYFDI